MLPLWLAGNATPSPAIPDAGFPWDFVGGIAIFVAMLVAAWLLIRVLSGRGFGRQGRYFRVMDRFPVSRDCSILLIAVGSRILAVCVGKEGGSLLCELEPEDLEGGPDGEAATRSARAEDGQDTSFGKRFVHNMKLNMGVLPKNTPPMKPPVKQQTADKNDTDFSALLQAVQQSGAAQDAPSRSAETMGTRTVANYRNAVENMHRLAQTEAPAVRRPASKSAPAAGSAPDQAGRVQSSDEETARELLRMLQERKTSHEKPGFAHTKTSAPDSETKPNSEEQIDEILDKIAQRQSRYAAPPNKRGSHDRKERS